MLMSVACVAMEGHMNICGLCCSLNHADSVSHTATGDHIDVSSLGYHLWPL